MEGNHELTITMSLQYFFFVSDYGITRLAPAVWLLGHPTSEVLYARLPSCNGVLCVTQYHLQLMTLRQSYNLGCEKLIKV